MPKMTDEQLQTIVKNRMEDALNYYDTELSGFRIEVQDYYNSEEFGNEQSGKSKVVTSDVQEVIEMVMPSVMRIFTSSKEYVRFVPRQQEDVTASIQATQYCNYIVDQNDGFTLFHNWFKSALLFKLGVLKFYWDESEDVTEESYNGLTLDELTIMASDDNIEIIEQDSRPINEDIEEQTDEMGNVIPIPMIYDVKIKKKTTSGQIKIINIPEEEFLIQRHTKNLADADFVAHRREMSVGDLVSMGYDFDEVMQYAGSGEELDQEEEKRNRFEDIDSGSPEYNPTDESQRKVMYTEAYIRVDVDDDKIPELRRVCTIGQGYHILMNEPFDHIPFAVCSPILMPHRMIGVSLAEQVMDLQLIKSTVLRQILDNLYLSNNTRLVAVDGQVNLDDIINNNPGGIIRAKQPGAVQPLTTPLIANQSFPLLDYLDQIKESRTGLNKASMGLEPDALQSTTASAVNQIVSASQGKIELIARVFAETGVKQLFKGILHLVTKHATQPQIVRLNNNFVPMDVRQWKNSYDMEVNVGLGTGQINEKLQVLDRVAKTQEQILLTMGMQNPLTNLSQYRETIGKMLELSGFKDVDSFFLDPRQQPPMQPQPSEAEQSVQADMMKAKAEIELKQKKLESDIQLAREKLMADIELKRQELNAELQLRGQAQVLGNKEVSQNL
tara:strand:+ start:612 stop:2618 length:2007 start_codon:yes stop_codon:yes gene_type:complete